MALQMLRDAQTQRLPEHDLDRHRLALSLDAPDWATLHARLQAHRERVAAGTRLTGARLRVRAALELAVPQGARQLTLDPACFYRNAAQFLVEELAGVQVSRARLLALQDDAGTWAGGAFFPKGFDFDGPEAADGAGQPWTATTWSLS